jgi:MFS family permease
MVQGTVVETEIPGRLDSLPWSRWHWLIVTALGVTWILDGLEVTLAGSVGVVLTSPQSIGLSDAQVGQSASFYLIGTVLGALFFGHATDRFGRKKLFFITLSVYLAATALTALAWNFASYALFRFLTGAGIGGEYAAINSAIDELIPARLRGRVDLIINSTYWIGAAAGALATVVLLDPATLHVDYGWRLSFGIGAALGLIILYFRHWVPESPRWLVIHGRNTEAERIVGEIEEAVRLHHPDEVERRTRLPIRIRTRMHTPWSDIWSTIAHRYRSRSLLALVLMSSQSFFYNAIFFTYALVLARFYQVPAHQVSWYILPFALGNLMGPVILGHLFDTVGRRVMIASTYAASGILLAITAWLFAMGYLSATTQAIAWTVIFFVASAAASSAYLTTSEIFPLETRAMALAIFFAAGNLVGGVAAPAIFAWLIESGSRTALAWGYLAGALFMIIAAVLEAVIGVDAEQKSLELVASPLSTCE